MAARRCERRVRSQLLSSLPDWKSIQTNVTLKINPCIDSPYPDELKHFKKLVSDGQLDGLVARYPLRESQVFDKIVTALECRNRRNYRKMLLARVRNDENLARKLKERISHLSSVLDLNFLVSKSVEIQ